MSCCDHTCGADAGRGKLCPTCRADARAMLDEPNAVVLLAPAELEALHAEITRLTKQRNTLLGALTATLPELGELENYWVNEADAFDNPFEDAERRLSLFNLEDTRRVIKRVRAAIKAVTK
jgi:hypothetical protein